MLQNAAPTPKHTPAPTSAPTSSTPASTRRPDKKPANPLASAFAKKSETKAKAEPKVKAEPKINAEKAEPKVKAKPKVNDEPKVKDEPEVKVVQSAAGKKTQKEFFSSWNAGSQKAKGKKASVCLPSPDLNICTQSNLGYQSPTLQAAKPVSIKMETDSEGEEEPTPAPKQDLAEESRKRKAKQLELEAMMDLSDPEPSPPPKKRAPTQSPSPPPPVQSTQPGRRRGKRKIMKKVTTKDEEGYLVTRVEPAWESYSEDEVMPVPPKLTPSKGKKPVVTKAKGQQGNIMNFFSKK